MLKGKLIKKQIFKIMKSNKRIIMCLLLMKGIELKIKIELLSKNLKSVKKNIAVMLSSTDMVDT